MTESCGSPHIIRSVGIVAFEQLKLAADVTAGTASSKVATQVPIERVVAMSSLNP